MNPDTFFLGFTIVISIWAFYDRSLLNKLILSPYAVVHKQQGYRVITHAFIHADWPHLLFNMFALWSFGGVVYQYFSFISPIPEIHFYCMYVGAIICSSVSDIIKKKNDPTYFSLGASGAVSAVIFSAIFFDPWSMIYIFFIPCPGIVFGVVYLLYSSYMGKKGGGHINHDAHFYGSVFGFLYPMLIQPYTIQLFIEQLTHPRF